MRRPVALFGAILLLAIASAAVWVVVRAARKQRDDPARCPAGLVAMGHRCCAPGQVLVAHRCDGPPESCPAGSTRATLPPDVPIAHPPESVAPFPSRDGCVPVPRRVRVAGGTLLLTASDWEAEGEIESRRIEVRPFEIDHTEVTTQRFLSCTQRGDCAALPVREPGLPVTSVSASEAEAFCRSEGGRLPSGDEWLFAAAGSEGRRYPWGQTGLVCRRAAFGLVDGPCASGALGPELCGSRPDGATPSGILDLAGNVAEWAREPDGSYRAHGGSFRSRVAGQLKSWAGEQVAERADHVGFRCVYDAAP